MLIQIKNKKLASGDLAFILVGFYGFSMYVLAFRKLGAVQFEMALQPEKLLLFFLLERIFFLIKEEEVCT